VLIRVAVPISFGRVCSCRLRVGGFVQMTGIEFYVEGPDLKFCADAIIATLGYDFQEGQGSLVA
jgi:hypothetical protein